MDSQRQDIAIITSKGFLLKVQGNRDAGCRVQSQRAHSASLGTTLSRLPTELRIIFG